MACSIGYTHVLEKLRRNTNPQKKFILGRSPVPPMPPNPLFRPMCVLRGNWEGLSAEAANRASETVKMALEVATRA